MDSYDNVYIAGSTDSFKASYYDQFLVKYHSSGLQQWYTTWGGTSLDTSRAMAIDSTDNVYVVGLTDGFGTSL